MEDKNLTPALSLKIKAMVENRYDLGTYAGAEIILGGTVNQSFLVRISRGGKAVNYFLREYNPAIKEEEIRFEHALLRHLRNDGFDLASIPFTDSHGNTYFQAPASTAQSRPRAPRTDHFWALFEFMAGQDKYTWTETGLNDRELASSGEILSRLHHHGANFVKPADASRAQPPIMAFLPEIRENFSACAASAKSGPCIGLVKQHLHRLVSIVEDGLSKRSVYRDLLKLPIHCDFHPGNLKYENGKGVGLFDFDWSKIDYRVFDLALALVYFSAQWRGSGAGRLLARPFRLFLSAYLNTCRRFDGISPLSPKELEALVPMLAYANLYVLNWSVSDYLGKPDADDDEYITYIGHGIRVMDWIETHRKELAKAVDAAFKS